MRLTVLGSGGSAGVPSIEFGWGKCDPAEPRNRRSRVSVLIEDGDTAILVDTSPDCRQQLLSAGVRRLDAVVWTHAHADHLHGIDDLRGINRVMKGPIRGHADAKTVAVIRQRFPYVLDPIPGPPYWRPWIEPQEIDGPFRVGPVEVVPFLQDHGVTTTLGFRFGPIAYSTDVVQLDDAAFAALAGVKLWVVDAFREEPHPTHAHLSRALDWIERLGPERALLTHMGEAMDYWPLRQRLPSHVEPAYDGQVVEVGGA